MCIFSGTVEHVGGTKLFGRKEGNKQFLVYSMAVKAKDSVAMILPIPVSSQEEDAVKFINLEEYEDFFDDMDKAFVELTKGGSRGMSPVCVSLPTLQVHEVGSFVASFVPKRQDFIRLDPRFRLSDEQWSKLPNYSDYGYAVFQLKDLQSQKNIHPMAFEFPSSKEEIFFPTVHLHDGDYHAMEQFDHDIYWQGSEYANPERKGNYFMEHYMSLEKTKGIVVAGRAYKKKMHGYFPNIDVLIEKN